MKNILPYITTVIIAVALSFLFGYRKGRNYASRHPVKVKGDTVTVYKTRYVDSPIEKSSIDIGLIAVPNYKFITEAVHDTTERTIVIHDTDTLWLPREQKYYEEMDGHARIWVSGYEPKLDRFEWDEPTVTIRPAPKRWNVSLSAGVGATPDGLSPFLGITLGRTIFSF